MKQSITGARALGLTKRQVQIAEKSALEKIRKAYRKLLDEESRVTK